MGRKAGLVAATAAALCSGALGLELVRGKAGGAFGLQDDYFFQIAGAEAYVIVWGREGSPTRQVVYVEYYGYFLEDCKGHIAELAKGNRLWLEDGRGKVRYPTAVRERGGCGFYESASAVFELQFEGEFRGDLRLGVKASGGQAERLDFGPAARDYFRRATVTESRGLNFRVEPDLGAEVKRVLRPGDTFYVTAFREIFWPGESQLMEDVIFFNQVTCDGEVGWVARTYARSGETFFEIGDFVAR